MRVAFGGAFTRLRCCHSIAVSGRYVLKSKLADVPPVPARRIAMNENAARNLAEAPATYAKDAADRSARAADEASNVVEQLQTKVGKGAKDLNLHFIAVACANMNAAFDFAQQLMSITSPSEFVELSAAHARKQFEMLNEQIKQLSTLVQHAATDSAQPLQAGAMKAFDRVA
jgi:phasin